MLARNAGGSFCIFGSGKADCVQSAAKVTRMTGWRSHKIIWRVYGGSDNMSNRVMLHPSCHSRVQRRDLEVVKPRLVTEVLSEA
jgi:hypothetical protein